MSKKKQALASLMLHLTTWQGPSYKYLGIVNSCRVLKHGHVVIGWSCSRVQLVIKDPMYTLPHGLDNYASQFHNRLPHLEGEECFMFIKCNFFC